MKIKRIYKLLYEINKFKADEVAISDQLMQLNSLAVKV